MNHSGPVTLSQVKSALQELGGEATWDEILDQVTKNRNGDYLYYLDWLNYKTTAFQVVQLFRIYLLASLRPRVREGD